jgi:predicted ATPase/DNA-binding SARP family transcriptional activator
VEFRVLGPVEARAADGARVALGGRRQRALLAALLLHEGREVGEDRLADLLWGDDLPSDPRAALHTCVARLRRALPEPERLQRGNAGYRLDLQGADLDLVRFRADVARAEERRRCGDLAGAAESLRSAVGRWAGDPMSDLLGLPVADRSLPRLGEERLRALEDRLSDEMELGRHREAVAELAELVEQHPLRERLRELHLLALYRSGRQSEALEGYRAARRTFVAELGVEPGPRLSRLHELVLQQDQELAAGPAPATPVGYLPHALSSFVGREREVDAVAELLATARLVTLTGAGGAGKTRLACEVAARTSGAYADGVWLIELAAVATQDLVPRQVADALGLVLEAGRPEVPALVEHCRRRALLLVLDNAEHLLDAVADLVLSLQRSAGGVRVLVTSRQPLACEGEHVWPVGPLGLPPTAGQDLPAVADSDAVQLFTERARAADPSFVLSPANADVVARVCERLDGLPLALELAAAWVPAVGMERLLDRLQSSLELVERTRRSSDARHRSLTAALDWSCSLLEPRDAQALRRLSVFVSGFDADAAAAVLETPPEAALDRLARLRAASLIVADGRHERRLRLLEPVRQYAAARLEESGEGAASRRAHLEWCTELAARNDPRLRNDAAAGPEVVALLEREHDELRAALARAVDDGRGEQAAALAADLWVFWWSAGHLSEAIGLLRQVVALTGVAGEAQARALCGLAFLECQDFDWEPAREHACAALEAFADLPEAARQAAHYAYALFVQAEVLTHDGELTGAREEVDEGLRIVRSVGDGWGYAFGTWVGANLAYVQGDLDEAHRGHTDMLAAMRQAGLPVAMVAALHSLGVLEMERERWADARAYLEEALELRWATGADRLGRYHGSTTDELRDLARIALRTGDDDAARRFAAEGLHAAAAARDDESAQACREVLERLGSTDSQGRQRV